MVNVNPDIKDMMQVGHVLAPLLFSFILSTAFIINCKNSMAYFRDYVCNLLNCLTGSEADATRVFRFVPFRFELCSIHRAYNNLCFGAHVCFVCASQPKAIAI